MKKHMGMVLLALLVVAMLLISTVSYTVSSTQKALIKTFGKTTRVLDGQKDADAGLKFKWIYPIQQLVRYDARTFVFEDTYSQIETLDKQNLLVTVFCAWRIADPVRFHSTIKTVEVAQERIRNLLRDHKKRAVARHNMEDFINTDPAKMLLERIEQEILEPVRSQAEVDYGVQVVMVGIKSLGIPEDITAAVIDAMKEERQRDVQRFESAGEAQATAIRERAKAASDQITEFARRKAAEIRSEGDRAAAEYYKEFARNERFSMFLRSLESLKKELSSRSVVVLDGSLVPAVKYFREGPSLPQIPPSGSGTPKVETKQTK